MIRQRLLERKSLDLATAFSDARSLEMAEKHSLTYQSPSMPTTASTDPKTHSNISEGNDQLIAATSNNQKCFFCGYQRHPRSKCPARDENCKNCGKKGHFAKVCRSVKKSDFASATYSSPLSTVITAASPASLSKAIIDTSINGHFL